MLTLLILFILLQLAIGWAAGRFIKSEQDYLLAGRNVGLIPATFSVFATWFGAEVVMGSSGAIARQGLSGGRADPFGYALCLVLMGLLLAGWFRTQRYVTVGDFFGDQYGRRNEVLASVILVLTSLIWAAAQIQAFALIVTALVPGLDMVLGLFAAMSAVVIYTWFGGLWGDVVTDMVQGSLIVVGLLVLLVAMVMAAGGWQPAIAHIELWQLSPVERGASWTSQLNGWAIPIIGSMVAPEALTRTLATKNATVARQACLWGGAMYFCVGSLVCAVALIGIPFLKGATDYGDMMLPNLVLSVFPGWMAVLFLAALVSAILSTIDSTLLSIAGMLGHNVLLPVIEKKTRHRLDEGQKVLLSRVIVVATGAAAMAVALGGKSIYGLVEMASSFGSAGFLVCVLGAIYGGRLRVGPLSATAVLLAGVVFTALFQYVWQLPGYFLMNLASCGVLYLALGWFEAARTTK
ncbi:MAG: sodium:solute symporter [Cyanobacteria bacterium HKST-UBA03]|nr:sodium:solute symporter [Cyanobacteria bacterium HKST-UBA03]